MTLLWLTSALAQALGSEWLLGPDLLLRWLPESVAESALECFAASVLWLSGLSL